MSKYEIPFNVRIPEHIHTRFKKIAAMERKSMNTIIIDLLRRYCKYYNYDEQCDEYSYPRNTKVLKDVGNVIGDPTPPPAE